MSRSTVQATTSGIRVLLVARTQAELPPTAPWDPGSPRWPWAAAAGVPATAEGTTGRGYDVIPVRADPAPTTPGAALRARLGGIRTGLRARRHGAHARWTQTLRRSRDLRRAVRAADVIWSLDPDTDAALRALPGLVGRRTVLGHEHWPSAAPALAALESLLAEVSALPQPSRPGRRHGNDPGAVERWQEAAGALPVDLLPVALRPVDAVVDALRTHRLHHTVVGSERAVVALDSAPWPEPERSLSGLAARRAAADLSLGALRWDRVDEPQLAQVAGAAVRGADQALDDGDARLALARLGDAISLLFHRARHAEVPRSALVEDPAAYLAPLRGSRTYQQLLQPSAEDRPRTPPAPAGGRQRVLVVTGAYGSFHAGVVAALEEAAEVRTRDLARRHPQLGRKVLDPWATPAVAVLAALERDGAPPSWADKDLVADVRQISTGVRRMLRWPDVVLADWADPATVWASHLCPPDVRLVVRIHALDALDPWLHLVRWDRVEQVVVVSEPLRSLVTDLLAAGPGQRVPVHVLPHAVPQLDGLARAKTASARTTLGMVGWGRRVKDVHWALDLLEREPSWELVLVGADFPDRVNPVVEPFVTRLRERLASPALQGRVHRVGQVEDVGEPLRRIGVILSASVRESWHLGLVEGAASGAVPVVRDWPLLASRGGPRTLFPPEWVVDDLDQAEARVRRVTDPDVWPVEAARARERALTLFDAATVQEAYRRLVLGARAPAAD